VTLSVSVQFPVSEPTLYKGWRCKHKGEPGAHDAPPNGMPEVRPSHRNGTKYVLPVRFTEVMQWIAYTVMSRRNHVITPQRFRNVFGGRVMLTNGEGWDDSRAGTRADFVNNRDTDAELPKLLDAIINGGTFLPYAKASGNELLCTPGIDGLDANSLPEVLADFGGNRANMMEYVNRKADEVLAKGWYFNAVSWYESPAPHVDNFTQGWDGADYYGPVTIVYFLRQITPYPLEWFEDWDSDKAPDHLTYYL
jgi:hypothetical protein